MKRWVWWILLVCYLSSYWYLGNLGESPLGMNSGMKFILVEVSLKIGPPRKVVSAIEAGCFQRRSHYCISVFSE
jgi:hypothetical protein